MQQKRPHLNPLILALALAAVLMIWSVFTTSNTPSGTTMSYSTVVHYFEHLQVTAFTLDRNTGVITMNIKEGDLPLPEGAGESAAQSGGLMSGLLGSGSSSADEVQANSDGTVTVRYQLPYAALFINEVQKYIDAYDAANPDAPMEYDYTALRDTVPWMEIFFYLAMLGCTGFILFSMLRGGAGGGNVMNVGRAKVKDESANQKTATFADVAGEDEEKEELKEVVEFLKSPEKFNSLGARIPHGVLLVGPPGTGKTLLAKAVAGEAGVQFLSISGSDFVELYVGVGASRVRDLFAEAKKVAPAVVFIDEIDAVGRQRGAGLGGGHDEREQTLNQLLVEMDGFAANEGVVVLAATNRRDILDPALLRPGRFDRQVYVGYPDIKGREEILDIYVRNKPLAEDVDLRKVARATHGFTGADLENLVNEAALNAAREDRKFINEQDLEGSVIKVIAGPEKRSRVVPEKERRLTAYHEAGHAVVIFALKTQDPVHQITIIPRGQAGGMTINLPQEDTSFYAKTTLTERIAVFLGGRVAEKLFLGDISTGAGNDIQRATALARQMVTVYGMSDRLGSINYQADSEEVFIGRSMGHTRPYSEAVAAQIDEEVKSIIDSAYHRCEEILQGYSAKMHQVADYLLQNETMDGETFRTMMEEGTVPEGPVAAIPAAPEETAGESDESTEDRV